MTPKVSVVIPNYNYGRFLARRLRSILDQTYTDLEVLYLDDCSTDNSEEVLAEFLSEPRLRAIRNDTNSGSAAGQFNKGCRLARGDYVWVAQADDAAHTDFLASVVPVLEDNPSVGMVYCQSLAVDENDEALHSMARRTETLDSERWLHDYVNDGRDECRRYLLFKNTIPNASAVVFRRCVLEQVGWADETLRLAWDHLTYINVLLVSDIGYCARPLNYFRHHPGTIRHQATRDGVQAMEGYQILAYLRERLDLSAAELEAAYDHIARSWLKKVLRRRKRTPLGVAARIHRAARDIDPNLNRRLVRQIFRL